MAVKISIPAESAVVASEPKSRAPKGPRTYFVFLVEGNVVNVACGELNAFRASNKLKDAGVAFTQQKWQEVE